MEVSLGKLLDQVAERGTTPTAGTIGRRTYKDVGFNMLLLGDTSSSNKAEKCYLHTGSSTQGLSEGDELILSVAPSQKVDERLDVISYTPCPKDFAGAIRPLGGMQFALILPLAYPKLSNEDWHDFWTYWFANPKEFQVIAKSLPQDWLSKIAKHCPQKFCFKLLDVIKPSAAYVWKLITKYYSDANNDDRQRVVACLEANPTVRAELAQSNLLNNDFVSGLNKTLREQSPDHVVRQCEIDLGVEHIDEESLFHCISDEYKKLDNNAWQAIWNNFKHDTELTVHFQKQLDPAVWRVMLRAQPIELLPAFLSVIEPPTGRLGEYLRHHYPHADEATKSAVHTFIDSSEAIKAQLVLMNIEQSGFPSELGLSLAVLDINGFVVGLSLFESSASDALWQALWNEWQTRPDEFVRELRAGLAPVIWEKARVSVPDHLLLKYLDVIEPVAVDLWRYLCCHHEKLSDSDKERVRSYLSHSEDIYRVLYLLPIAPAHLPMALEYFVPQETTFWPFITEHWDSAGEEVQGIIRTAIQNSGYTQANFLLFLVARAVEHDDYPMQLLAKDVEILVGNLFDQHSVDQSRIGKTIFMDCPVRRGFAACEASIAPNKNAGKRYDYKDGTQPDFNYWCRRSPCDSAVCLVKHEVNDDQQLRNQLHSVIRYNANSLGDFYIGGYFYTLVGKFWGYSKSSLHDQVNGAFIRPLAAINRWNELVERLHCHDCQGTLRISEHSPNSINKMAYAVTYWHCGDQSCTEYARSVKLSHCQGNRCDKIIDSREDRQSCTPWEVRSYKKMYLCTMCGSCCPTHAKSGGYVLCPGCGRDKAYAAPPDGRGQMTCVHCDHQVTVPWDKREQVRDTFHQAGAPQGVAGAQDKSDSTLFVLPCQFLDEVGGGVFSLHYTDDKPLLYVYDLFACLKNGYVTNLSKYHKIYDIRLIEKLHYLGQFHNRYNAGKPQLFGLLKHLKNVNSQSELDELAGKVSGYITKLIAETSTNGVINHYEQIELPFTLSLFSLLGGGFTINNKALTDKVAEVELARNIAVESLRAKGIDTPTRDELKTWLPHSDSEFDTAVLLNRIDHIDFKSIRHLDPIFEAFYRIEKIERMGDSIKSVFGLQGPILPDYQIVGTNTLRCTSQRPNLLGFPKQLRPVVKAREGRCIVECDYGQMDVGVVAALSDDAVLISDYNSGDVYSVLAQELGIDRDRAKLVFLGILYGVGRKTLQLWLEKDEIGVEALLEQFFSRYPALDAYQDKLVQQGERLGYVEAVTGLRRSVKKKGLRQSVDVDAIRGWQRNWFKNYPVQASSAIIFKRAIVEVAENVEPRAFKLIAPLYDALIFEVPLEQKDYYTGLVCSAMKRAMAAYFPNLNTHVTVNDHDVSCWNGGEGVAHLKESMNEGGGPAGKSVKFSH